jgi:hypothetical protein
MHTFHARWRELLTGGAHGNDCSALRSMLSQQVPEYGYQGYQAVPTQPAPVYVVPAAPTVVTTHYHVVEVPEPGP